MEHQTNIETLDERERFGGATFSVSRNIYCTVSIIDPRLLLSQCFLLALRLSEPSAICNVYTSIAEWSLATDLKRDQIVIFFETPGEDGDLPSSNAGSIASLMNFSSELKIVIVSDREDPTEIVKAIELGARGYILSSLPLRIVVQALNIVRAGGVYVPATSLLSLLTQTDLSKTAEKHGSAIFSKRELSITKAIRKGTPNKIIAYELGMCESTVKVHVRNIMKKLKAKNRTEVAYLTKNLHAMADDYEHSHYETGASPCAG